MKTYLICIGIGLNMFFREYYLVGSPINANNFTEQFEANLRLQNLKKYRNGIDR